jgi:hypothetical protein
VALVAIAGAWMLLPLVPTLREFHLKTDRQPFEIVQENPFNPAHFADVFSEYLRELRHEIEACRRSGAGAKGMFDDGQSYQIISDPENRSAVNSGIAEESILIFCEPGSMSIPARFRKEVYAAGDLSCAASAVFTAILCQGSLHLGTQTTVLHWAHSHSHLEVGNGGILLGRLTSGGAIRLGRGTSFQRIHAQRIDFGESALAAREHRPSFVKHNDVTRDKRGNGEPLHRRKIFEGDLEIAAGSVWTGDVIVKGRVVVAAGASVLGSIKGYQNISIGSGARVQGSIVAVRDLELGEECAVLGPVISEGTTSLRAGCHIGAEQQPTTLTAMNIEADAGAVVFGTVWARENGNVHG